MDVLVGVNLKTYCISVNTCQNQAKLCTVKVQNDMQLAISQFGLSIKDLWSQVFFKDFTAKGLGPKKLFNEKIFRLI